MSCSKGKILVVDDELANQEICAIMLDELGYSYDIASNGKEAIDACSTNKYDLILMDSNMPVMDGIESIRQIRTIERQSNDIEQYFHTPIVLVSGNIDKSILNDVKVDGFLQKPFNMEQLQCICDQYLSSQNKSETDLDKNINCKKKNNEHGSVDESHYFDRDAFEELCSLSMRNNSDLHIIMTNRFIELVPNEIKDIRIALENNYLENLDIKIHELASWCGFLGVVGVVNILKKLEHMVREKDLGNVGVMLSELDEQVKIVSSILKDKRLKEDIPVEAKVTSLPVIQ